MDSGDTKKKKKNRKKKNKQTSETDTVSADIAQPSSLNHNHFNGPEKDDQSRVSETSDYQDDIVHKTAVDSDKHSNEATGNPILVEAEKLYWLDKEATLERKIRELQENLATHVQKQEELETSILHAQAERNSWSQKEVDLNMIVSRLQTEKDCWLQKEVTLEQKIRELQEDLATHVQKQKELEMSILHAQAERNSWSQKEVDLNMAVSRLQTEKDCWLKEESSTQEIIDALNNENKRFQEQVMELEASKNYLFDQNVQLNGNLSDLKSQIENLETLVAHSSTGSKVNVSEKDMSSELEAAQALVGKLLSENAELVEKVNDLYAELDSRSGAVNQSPSVLSNPMVQIGETIIAESSAPGSHPVVESAKTASIAEGSSVGTHGVSALDVRPESIPLAVPTFESSEESLPVDIRELTEDQVIKPKKDDIYSNMEGVDVISYPRESLESVEIVQIPLDEEQVNEQEASQNALQTDDVPLTDAPLTGAPFRFISLIARYVSGADLVDKSSTNPGR